VHSEIEVSSIKIALLDNESKLACVYPVTDKNPIFIGSSNTKNREYIFGLMLCRYFSGEKFLHKMKCSVFTLLLLLLKQKKTCSKNGKLCYFYTYT
jgi:hypothetical protein